MIAYLKGDDKKYELNEYALSIPKDYHILDRFLLLATGLKREEYEQKVVGREELDSILC